MYNSCRILPILTHRSVVNVLRGEASAATTSNAQQKRLTKDDQEKLRKELPKLKVEKDVPSRYVEPLKATASSNPEIDEIRARGFMQYKYVYNPPSNISEIVDEVANEFALDSENGGKFESLDLKANVLIKLGTQLKHFVPNAKLHYIQSIDDVKKFYSTPVDNITEYAKLARSENVPENLAVRENPVRFHPNDKEATHGGVTAFPGTGGKVIGLRNKRIYRQFRPKQEWYDFEDQTFDHEPVDKGMPWDTEIAKKMDSYADRKFKKDGFYNNK